MSRRFIQKSKPPGPQSRQTIQRRAGIQGQRVIERHLAAGQPGMAQRKDKALSVAQAKRSLAAGAAAFTGSRQSPGCPKRTMYKMHEGHRAVNQPFAASRFRLRRLPRLRAGEIRRQGDPCKAQLKQRTDCSRIGCVQGSIAGDSEALTKEIAGCACIGRQQPVQIRTQRDKGTVCLNQAPVGQPER